MLTEENRLELERFQEQLKESLKDIDVASLSMEDAKKVYSKISSKVYGVLGMDFDMPEPGTLNYGEILVNKIMTNVGLKYRIEDFLPRYQQEPEERYFYQSPDDLPPQK